MDELTPALTRLAEHYRVATSYHDWQGQPREVSRRSLVAVLTALGAEVGDGSDEVAARALDTAEAAAWLRLLPACVVLRAEGDGEVHAHLEGEQSAHLWIELEGGGRVTLGEQHGDSGWREIDGRWIRRQRYVVPPDVALGWHTLHAQVYAKGATEPFTSSTATLVITPGWLGMPAGLGRQVGVATQLYAMRSKDSWGIGDLADLTTLARWAAREMDAGFVLVNPLHAAQPTVPMEPSPYLPTTRRFINPVYLRVEDVPEWSMLAGDDKAAADAYAAQGRALTAADTIDRDASWAAKLGALTLVHAVPRSAHREEAYAAFVQREDPGLGDFATWCALAELHGDDWTRWPDGLQHPLSPAVAAARTTLAGRVDLYRWLQWLVTEQLDGAAAQVRDAGAALGVMGDLAVGVHPNGAEAWGLQDVFARGMSVGAPADAFNQQGQDWSQPPWRPDQLEEASYAPYRAMLQAVLRYAGAVRIDHVLGLFRLWWVPDGALPADGTYVRYDHEAMIGILALEASRAGAVVVGEDLGTVEPWVRDYLKARGIFGTSVLWFERDWDHDRPKRPQEWRELSLAAVTTHDLPPTAGFLRDVHVHLRERLGLLTRSAQEETAESVRERVSWLELLHELNLLDPADDQDDQAVIEALHRYLLMTPAQLLVASVSDLCGDRRVINQPGTSNEYPNWRVPLAGPSGAPLLLEELLADPRALSLAAVLRAR